jgi:hypothetical protein
VTFKYGIELRTRLSKLAQHCQLQSSGKGQTAHISHFEAKSVPGKKKLAFLFEGNNVLKHN